MTPIAQCPPASYSLFQQASAAVGPDALLVNGALEDVRKDFSRSVYLAGHSESAITKLKELAARSTEADWDGEGAAPISLTSYGLACELLKNMGRDWPSPDIDLESDGTVAFHWESGPAHRLSIIVGSSGTLSYAWMIPSSTGGLERYYGVADSLGAFPTSVSQTISKFRA